MVERPAARGDLRRGAGHRGAAKAPTRRTDPLAFEVGDPQGLGGADPRGHRPGRRPGGERFDRSSSGCRGGDADSPPRRVAIASRSTEVRERELPPLDDDLRQASWGISPDLRGVATRCRSSDRGREAAASAGGSGRTRLLEQLRERHPMPAARGRRRARARAPAARVRREPGPARASTSSSAPIDWRRCRRAGPAAGRAAGSIARLLLDAIAERDAVESTRRSSNGRSSPWRARKEPPPAAVRHALSRPGQLQGLRRPAAARENAEPARHGGQERRRLGDAC